MTSQPDRDNLRALAERATPGPWAVQGPWPTATIYVDDAALNDDNIQPTHIASLTTLLRPEQNVRDDPDAAYIAVASPDRIIALLDERDEMQTVIDNLHRAGAISRDNEMQLAAERDSLSQQLEAMRKERDEAVALKAIAQHELRQARACTNDVSQDCNALSRQVTTLTADLAAAKVQLAAVEAERDAALSHAAVQDELRNSQVDKFIALKAERDRLQQRFDREPLSGIAAQAAAIQREAERDAARAQVAQLQGELNTWRENSARWQSVADGARDALPGDGDIEDARDDEAERIAAMADEQANEFDADDIAAPRMTLREFAADIRDHAHRSTERGTK